MVAILFVFTLAVPQGVVPANTHLPISWLWSWLRPLSASALPSSPNGPRQGRGPTGDPAHSASTAATRGTGGTGRPADIPAAAQAGLPKNSTPTLKPTHGFDPGTSTKLTGRSDAHSDLYQNTDGTLTRRVYSGAVNYQAADKSWKPINTALVRGSDGRLRVAANSVQVSFTGKGSAMANDPNGAAVPDLATLTLPTGESVGYGLDGAAAVTPTMTGADAVYPGILASTDLVLTTVETGFKDTLILKSPDAPSTWIYQLKLTGLTAQVDDDGSVGLYNTAGARVAWFPQGGMVDSNVDPYSGDGVHSAGVTYSLISTKSGPALQVTADSAWLHDPARVFPVKVDPAAASGTSGDVYVDNDSSTTASDQNGDNLAVGTYNGGTVKSRTFIEFNTFATDVPGYRITSANLKLYLTWAYSCATSRPFYVSTVGSAWNVPTLASASLSSGSVPTINSPPIGSYTETSPGAACTNTAGNRSVGKWEAVPLNPAALNRWVSDSTTNFGLAVTASETDSYGWKRFTSANYAGNTYKPWLDMTYSSLAPQIDAQYPPFGFQSGTLRPELVASAHDPDGFPKPLTYVFTVYDGNAAVVTQSTAQSTPRWTVPAGALTWGQNYSWSVTAYDGSSYSTSQTRNMFTTTVPQPVLTAGLAQNGEQGFDPSSGNYTMAATDASITTVGPSLAIDRAYNSDDPRTTDAFGAGWSSIADVKATEQLDIDGSVKTVVVTYPNGQEVAFGRNPDGELRTAGRPVRDLHRGDRWLPAGGQGRHDLPVHPGDRHGRPVRPHLDRGLPGAHRDLHLHRWSPGHHDRGVRAGPARDLVDATRRGRRPRRQRRDRPRVPGSPRRPRPGRTPTAAIC